MKKQFLAKLLVLAMVLTMVPFTILAASAEDSAQDSPDAVTETPTPEDPDSNGDTNNNGGTTANDDYSYSVAADAVIPEELPEDGVIVVKAVGGIANAVLPTSLVADMPVDDSGNKVIKLDTSDATVKVSVTVEVEALVDENGDETGVSIECTQGTITIPGDQLAKKVAEVKATSIAIVIVPAAAGAEVQIPDVTVYLNWIATKIPGMKVV